MTGSGKWAEKGVPHKGWTCVDIEDLGSPSETCEMCEIADIRYVHYMEHPGCPQVLRVGCVCAGNMEENLERAERREKSMKSAARRRKAWPGRKAWKVSQKGNWYISEDGYVVTIFRKNDNWNGVISNDALGIKHFARRTYPDATAAKLAAFYALVLLKSRN
ncbi:MAG: hypothetical protein EOS31_21515 [Mesorhizobium sp.]|uniref:hypothetical protein n=1 Tax=unclassified Mesorhizobium TaxID=325217 RepID=UPI000FCA0814|nr:MULTISPECIES: hypothetical protein [unclassified Mesorhizobium]RUW32846.1 hypothetical protein EOA37_31465 [Mesorhizobium sp. M2A.F.Ca.ET.015.02.1.1]RVC89584.1 hypothetical protein EN739_33420 [Mesorhizobium sp. M2A.F.Ca.ET.017.03.2.1]RVC96444.1 hypothetical protein EN753_31200 [Mesorhizobium sp. M2A.F.Ca.ET.029.05.1.1]RWC81297.1 MAG: hypothetical protein EOS31_21515 [Mesorhizobium sp.]RWF59348.1 MAG: hypothetical protein EOS66_06550 [Mesorhizobium sp.]